MDREKIVNRVRKENLELVHIPSTVSDQDRRKIVQDFAKKVEGIRSSSESILLFIRP